MRLLRALPAIAMVAAAVTILLTQRSAARRMTAIERAAAELAAAASGADRAADRAAALATVAASGRHGDQRPWREELRAVLAEERRGVAGAVIGGDEAAAATGAVEPEATAAMRMEVYRRAEAKVGQALANRALSRADALDLRQLQVTLTAEQSDALSRRLFVAANKGDLQIDGAFF